MLLHKKGRVNGDLLSLVFVCLYVTSPFAFLPAGSSFLWLAPTTMRAPTWAAEWQKGHCQSDRLLVSYPYFVVLLFPFFFRRFPLLALKIASFTNKSHSTCHIRGTSSQHRRPRLNGERALCP